MTLPWERVSTSDDMGTRAAPAKVEVVWVAHDGDGCEWLVAPHDDGTWNWTLEDASGELVELRTDFKTPEAARASAEGRAAELAGSAT